MEINVRKIAELSALDISDEDIPRFESDMNEIVSMFLELPEIEDNGLTIQPMELRSDTCEKSGISREEFMKNAPEAVNGCFVVPRTVEY